MRSLRPRCPFRRDSTIRRRSVRFSPAIKPQIRDPDTLIEQIAAWPQATNAGVLVIRPEHGSKNLQDAGECTALFAREVLDADGDSRPVTPRWFTRPGSRG